MDQSVEDTAHSLFNINYFWHNGLHGNKARAYRSYPVAGKAVCCAHSQEVWWVVLRVVWPALHVVGAERNQLLCCAYMVSWWWDLNFKFQNYLLGRSVLTTLICRALCCSRAIDAQLFWLRYSWTWLLVQRTSLFINCYNVPFCSLLRRSFTYYFPYY